MTNIVCIWKPVGITPFEAIQIFNKKNPKYRNETISYAGRLDPMAEGVLILLIGKENKNRDKYLKLKKEYESEIILGISTDTYDSLGLITDQSLKAVSRKEIEKSLKSFIGKQNQDYPPYSSKTVNGKPLYWWARNKNLNEIKIPNHEIEIYSIKLLNFEKVFVEKTVSEIIKQIKKVEGDFRQEDIIKSWGKFSKENNGKELIKIKIKTSCSSGTYVRGIASSLGEKLKTGAFTYSIKRTRVGGFKREDCLDLKI